MKAQQLKNAILQLAIQGKLVLQDPNDEPARVLLEKIQAEKVKLITEGKIKKSRKTSDKLPSPTEADFPFDIPESWVWVRLDDISSYIQRGKSPEYSLIKEFPVISQKCIQWSGLDISKAKFINKGSLKKYSNERFLQDNDLLWNSTGLGTLGRIAIYQSHLNIYSLAVVDSHVTIIRLIKILSKFVYFYLSSPAVQFYIEGQSDGSTKQKELSLKTISNYLIPLPPLNEQKRIVAKLEELLPFIDEYDKKEQKLTALNQQFPEQLKKSILQSAIQGKLVEQDPNDEPASKLIKRIQAEKERLILEKKIKKPKVKSEIIVRDNLPYEMVNGVERCIAEEVPFEIPESWCWVRLEEISEINPKNQLDDVKEVSFIPMKLIDDGYNNSHSFETRLWRDIKKGFTHFSDNDIAIAKITPCFENRKSVIFNNLVNSYGAGTTELFIVRLYKNLIENKFIFWFIKSQHFIENGIKSFSGTAGQQRVSSEYIKNCLIPLPPLNEQKRIVQKIEELFSYLQHL